jgi:hypothetical protein
MLSSAGSQVSTEVQQRPRTAASSDDRQRTQQVGTTPKRPAAPPVRDEESAGSNEGPVLLRPCCTNLPVDTFPGTCLGAGGKSRAAANYAPSGMPSKSVGTGSSADTESSAAGLGSPTEGIGARRPVPGSLAVQRSVHDLASLQYQRMSAQACPPSGTIRSSGSSMPHSEHWAGCDGR